MTQSHDENEKISVTPEISEEERYVYLPVSDMYIDLLDNDDDLYNYDSDEHWLDYKDEAKMDVYDDGYN